LERLVAAVTETANGIAQAAGLGPDYLPQVERSAVLTPSVANDPGLCVRLTRVLEDWLGEDRIKTCRPLLGSEDFSRFGEVDPPLPLTLFFLGVTEPDIFAKLQADPARLPRLHTPTFSPAVEPALELGMRCFTAATLELLGRPDR
jgi:hippurate hydrolase